MVVKQSTLALGTAGACLASELIASMYGTLDHLFACTLAAFFSFGWYIVASYKEDICNG